MDISIEEKMSLLKKMVLIRAFEEKTETLFDEKLISGFVHLAIGQEASTVGSCAALRPDDYIISTHRGHAHILAKGADPRYMFAEILGKETGYCKGKGGSMHIADFDLGILGANGVVGAGFPIMVGAGFSIKLRKTDQVGIVFFGDGASNRGTFHEACNIAAVFKLPIVFVCENNRYASTSPAEKMVAGGSVANRAHAYGIPGYITDGSDVQAVLETVQEAVDRARSGKGPTIVENETLRYKGHFEGDRQKYRTVDEVHTYRMNRDPIDRFETLLIEEGCLTKESAAEIWTETTAMIDEAAQFGMDSPLPKPEDALKDLFVNP
ncbi:thiamine pyrophosphate-dependent dehydrogenase E1 component subunit alpha [Spirochaetota bacterium]